MVPSWYLHGTFGPIWYRTHLNLPEFRGRSAFPISLYLFPSFRPFSVLFRYSPRSALPEQYAFKWYLQGTIVPWYRTLVPWYRTLVPYPSTFSYDRTLPCTGTTAVRVMVEYPSFRPCCKGCSFRDLNTSYPLQVLETLLANLCKCDNACNWWRSVDVIRG
jgi:hypothetical protein